MVSPNDSNNPYSDNSRQDNSRQPDNSRQSKDSGGISFSSTAREAAARRYFTGYVDYTMCELGIANPQLVTYLGELLYSSYAMENLFPLKSNDGTPITTVFGMLVEANRTDGEKQALIYKGIGDFTLIVTGALPFIGDGIKKKSQDAFLDYNAQGKRCYQLASRSGIESLNPGVLEALSVDYDLCQYGLNQAMLSINADSGFSGAILL